MITSTEIFDLNSELRALWSNLSTIVENRSSELNELPLKQFGGVSLHQINDGILLVTETIGGVTSEEDVYNNRAIFLVGNVELVSGIKTCISAIKNLSSEIGMRLRDDETRITIHDDTATLEFIDKGTVQDTYVAEGNINNIISGFGTIIRALAPLLMFVRSEGGADLVERANALRQIVAETWKYQAQTKAIATEISKIKKSITTTDQAIKEKSSEIATIATSVQTLKSQVESDSSSITTQISSIKATNVDAQKLETAVNNYNADFEEFQEQLDSRNKNYNALVERIKIAETDLGKQLTEIERLTVLADSMLTGATTAGLSSSLEEARQRYEDRMKGARIGFIISIGILGVASVVTLYMWYNVHLLNPQGVAVTSWPEVFRGLALFIPASWVTAFFARSYAHYFQLEREYAHKTALAMSVDGFKKQAPKYEEDITAAVFTEVSKNPSASRDVDPVRHPWQDLLIRAFPVRKNVVNHPEKVDGSKN